MVGQYGTHVDPPAHFAENGITMDKIPLKQMILPLVVLDAQRTARRSNHAFSVDDHKAWERQHGPVPKGAFAALRTDGTSAWRKDKSRWNPLQFIGDTTAGSGKRSAPLYRCPSGQGGHNDIERAFYAELKPFTLGGSHARNLRTDAQIFVKLIIPRAPKRRGAQKGPQQQRLIRKPSPARWAKGDIEGAKRSRV